MTIIITFIGTSTKQTSYGGLPSTCPSQTQDPLGDQGRHITRLGSLHLDQNKLCMALEVRSFPSSTIPDEIDRPSRLDISDGQINLISSPYLM